MKEIRLQSLTLKDFKGMSFSLGTESNDTNVYGANATGKTTLADGVSWLLFDKDSQGKSDFEIKNLDAMGREEHGLDHSVEGVLSVGGYPVTLRKVYRERWEKKRGNSAAVLAGNTTDYFIDGVPVQKKEYTAKIVEIAGDESVFKLLTSPTVFPALHWTKQRALLLEVCGDISDLQVIESDSKLSGLTGILGNRSIDDHKKVISARKTEINKEIERIPVRIDEVRRGLPDITGLKRKEIEHNVITLESSLNDAKLRLQGIDNGANIAELSKKLAGIDADIQKMERDHYNERTNASIRINAKINEVNEAKDAHERKSKNLSDEIATKRQKISASDQELSKLRESWGLIDSEQFPNTVDDTCPACGQALPSDRVEEARERALGEFNRSKAERLTKIEEDGKAKAQERGTLETAILTLQKALLELPGFESAYNLDDLTADRDRLKKEAENYSLVTGYAELSEQKIAIEGQIKNAKDSVFVDKNKIQEEINSLDERLKAEKGLADIFPRREQGEKRIEDLKQEEKTLATEFEKLEQELFLCELFIKTKVSMLNERINQRFEFVRFKLFDVQVNGAITECCVATVEGVPYDSGLNSAGKIQAGLDIIRTLQEHYGLYPVVWIDNRESCTEIPKMQCQVISLYVSPEDKKLRVETTREVRAA